MKKKSGMAFAAAFLVFFAVLPVTASAETFEEYRERTRREQEEQRQRQQQQQQQQQQNNNDDKDDDGWGQCFGSCMGAMLQGMCEAMAEDSRNHPAPPPPPPPPDNNPDYSGPSRVPSVSPVFPYAPGGDKFWSIELRGGFPVLFAGDGPIFGYSAEMDVTLAFLHLDASYDMVTDGTQSISTFKSHIGFAIPLERILIAVYGGVFVEPSIPYTGFSFGAQMRIYLTESVMWSLDGFCSISGTIFYTGGSTSVGIILDRFVLAGGVDLKNYNNLFMWGPSVHVSLWM